MAINVYERRYAVVVGAPEFAADFLVPNASLDAIPVAWTIARPARAILRQNLAWAAAFHALAIPLAASGVVSPWLAAANAMRLAGGDAVAATVPRPPMCPPPTKAERC
jgi:hypothetical protein